MKKIRTLSLILALVMALCVFVSCGRDANVAENGTATVVIETAAEGDAKYEVYEVDLSKLEKRDEGALSLLEYIGAEEGSTLYFSLNFGGGYGAYVNSMSSINPNAAAGEYVGVYTSVESDFSVPTEYMPVVSTLRYDGKTLTYSRVGISSMTIEDGSVVLFRLEKY